MFDFLKPKPAAYQNLSPEQFAAALRQPEALLLDVRRPEEFASGHLPGALNVEVTAPDFAQRVAALDHSRPVYVYCRSGARSARPPGSSVGPASRPWPIWWAASSTGPASWCGNPV